MPFDKFGMLIREEVEEPEEPEEERVTKYYFYMDDGEHNNRIYEFTDLEEAKKNYEASEKEAMADPEKFFEEMGCGPKENWIEGSPPTIALEEWTVLMKDDGEEELLEMVRSIDWWSPDLDELEEKA
tara:strand:- start:74 stop:454 length:381 start_codon:yes stop_codon:yes gene_type:complete